VFFFYRGAACTGQANPVGGAITQPGFEFIFATADGPLAQSRDLSNQLDAPVAIALGFEGGIPAPLLFVAATEDEIDLMMDDLLRMISLALALQACTLMYARHG